MSIAVKNIKSASIIFILLCLFLLRSEAAAQDIIEKIVDNGDDPLKNVWVILAEGYTASELAKFQSDTTTLTTGFFSVSPFKEYKTAINVYTVFSPSYETGADHPSDGIYADTAFDATFETYGIDRLLTVNDEKALNAASQIQYFDAVFALVNDDQYGGSGGGVIVVSTNENSIEIALHEAGHVVGKLADEYETEYPGYPSGDNEPNVTYQTKREKVPWKDWIESDIPLPTPEDYSIDSIGLFEGARYLSGGIYRPKHNCKMRSLNEPFCEVCREALVLYVYDVVNPIEKFGPIEPETELAPGRAVTLWVEPLKLDGSPYDPLWEIDDEILELESQMELVLFPSSVKKGKHTVSIWINDATDMVKTDNQGLLISQHTWNINKSFCSGKIAANIVDDKNGRNVTNASVQVPITNDTLQLTNDGKYELSDIACGSYSVTIDSQGFLSTEKEISITDGQTTLLDIALKSEAGSYYITGNITGEVKEGFNIELSGDASTSAKADRNGVFMLGPVTPGSFTITPKTSGTNFTPHSLNVEITDNDVSGITFNAKEAGFLFAISGIIHGDIKDGILISASGQKQITTVTDAQGIFEFEDLPAGRYVLKPNYQGITFEPAQLKVELTDKNLSGQSFVAKESSCPVTQISAQGSPTVNNLRLFRDNVLSKNTRGIYYVRLYYLVSSEVSNILLNNNSLRKEALQVLNECMPIIKMSLKDGNVIIPDTIQKSIESFARHLSCHGSPMLKKVIDQFLRDAEQGALSLN